MAFGYGGFLGLSSTTYRLKLKTRTDSELQVQEIVKLRRMFACTYIALGGFATVRLTFGGSLVAVGISGRRWRVADRKLDLIRDELTRRGIPHHKLQTKDILITLASCLVAGAVAHGIDIGLGEAVDVGNAQMPGAIRATKSMDLTPLDEASAVIDEPGKVFAGIWNGFVHQDNVISEGGVQIHEAINDTTTVCPSQDSVATSVVVDQEQVRQTIASAAGMEIGQAMALQSESTAGQLLAFAAVSYALEAFENPDHYRRAIEHLGCNRLYGVRSLSCDGCGNAIQTGLYMRRHHQILSPPPERPIGGSGCSDTDTFFSIRL